MRGQERRYDLGQSGFTFQVCPTQSEASLLKVYSVKLQCRKRKLKNSHYMILISFFLFTAPLEWRIEKPKGQCLARLFTEYFHMDNTNLNQAHNLKMLPKLCFSIAMCC